MTVGINKEINSQPENKTLNFEEREELNKLVIRVERLALKQMKEQLGGDRYNKIVTKWLNNRDLAQQTRELIEKELTGKKGEPLTARKDQLTDLVQRVYNEIFQPIFDKEPKYSTDGTIEHN